MRRLFTILLLGLAGCTTQLPGSQSSRPQGDFVRSELWQSARGYDLDRMIINGGSYSLYRTVWQSEGEQYLVCLQYPGVELFGTPYNVFLYDRDLVMLRHGTITAQQDYEPLAIVEVRPDNDELPPTRNEIWQLAVVFSHRSHQWDSTKPIQITGFDAPDDAANYVMCELIDWADDSYELPYGSGNLSAATRIEYRTAEEEWTVDRKGVVGIKPSSWPENAP